MDSKAFISRMARQMDCDTKCVSDLVAAFASFVRDKASELDTIAIPGLGNFVSVKKIEKIEADPATGKQMLLPPKITVEFVAGSTLNKRLSDE